MKGAVHPIRRRPGSGKVRAFATGLTGLLLSLPLPADPAHAANGRAALSVGATVVPVCTASSQPEVAIACSGAAPANPSGPSAAPPAISKAFPAAVTDAESKADTKVLTITF
jgi:hypothetical protein